MELVIYRISTQQTYFNSLLSGCHKNVAGYIEERQNVVNTSHHKPAQVHDAISQVPDILVPQVCKY